VLPNGTSLKDLERVHGLSPGLMSAGISSVPAAQTYLDVSQGNRVSESLYDGTLPNTLPHDSSVPGWGRIVERADSAPADIVPGLLAGTLHARGLPILTGGEIGLPAILAAGRNGGYARVSPPLAFFSCPAAVCVLPAGVPVLSTLVRSLRGDDLLIAIERPPPESEHQLAIAIAGRGFDGNLTSDSTRLRGYVLSTDIAPTILDRLGISIPSEMSGQPIHSDGAVDYAGVISLEDRLASIIQRRGSVIGLSALAWIAIAALVALASRGALGRPVAQLAALSGIYLPLMLLGAAAFQPSEALELAIVGLGAPLLAAVTLRWFPGYRSLAVACGLTTLGFAIDVIAGSPLTPLSLIGPDPGLGVRFYGIGNELEATLTPLILVGTGAAISAWRPDLPPRRAAAVFVIVTLTFAFVFAFGRFGAAVGAAIVLPVGAAGAVAVLGAARRTVVLVVAAPIVALAALAFFDLALGGDSHLTRSVLDAGGLHQLGDVAERRLRLSAHSFARAVDAPLLWVAVVGIAVAVYFRERILSWLAPTPAFRAGFLAAALAILVATVANDSGALLLEVGSIYLLLFAAFAWTQATDDAARRPAVRDSPPA
jgi:hypothetical protein